MKTFQFLSARTIALALAASFLFVSCSDDDDEPAPSTPTYYLTCKVNGLNYVASRPTGADTTDSFGDPFYVVFNDDSTAVAQFALGLTDDPSSSQWDFQAIYIDQVGDFYDEILTTHPVVRTVVHDSVNHILSGTFAFHLAMSWDTTNQVTVTEGQYRVKY